MTRMTLAVVIPLALLALPVCAGIAPEQAMQGTLKDFAFEGTLLQGIEQLAKQAGVKIETEWDVLDAAGAKAYAKVFVKAPRASAGQLLDAMLAQVAQKGAPLTWKAGETAVRVTTQQRMLNSAGVITTPAPAAPSAQADKGGKSEKPAAEAKPVALPAASREFSFDNMPLSDVLNFFKEAAGVNMHVNWRALQAVNIDKNTPVSFKTTGVQIGKAMDLIFDELNAGKSRTESVYWVIDEGVLLISTGQALDQVTRVKTIDVTDILMIVPNFKGPLMDLTTLGNNGNINGANNTNNTNTGIFGNSNNLNNTNNTNNQLTPDEDPVALKKKNQETLINAIKDSIGKEMWAPDGKGSVSILGNKLIISQTLLGFKLMQKAGAN
ncbi:MAG: hypothetical protein ACE15C_11420 [Phycisphaerae bacterium]